MLEHNHAKIGSEFADAGPQFADAGPQFAAVGLKWGRYWASISRSCLPMGPELDHSWTRVCRCWTALGQNLPMEPELDQCLLMLDCVGSEFAYVGP